MVDDAGDNGEKDGKSPRKCPSCGVSLDGQTDRCPFCGKVLRGVKKRPVHKATLVQVDAPKDFDAEKLKDKRCPSCYNMVSPTAVMCYICGHNLSPRKPGTVPTKEYGANKAQPKEDIDWQLTEADVKNFEARLDEIDGLLRKSPKTAALWLRRGSILMELKRYEDAIKAYNQGIKYKPTSLKAWSAKAYAVNKLGNQEEAVKCYQKAMEICMAQSMELDQLLSAVDRSSTYSEALDRAIGVLVSMKPASTDRAGQPRCPDCLSFKVLPAGDGYMCYKCKTHFRT